MPGKDTFIPIEDGYLNHFNLELEGQCGLLVSNELRSVYLTDDITNWEKVVDILRSSNYDLDNHSGKKRIYVLGNCGVTLDRIKSTAREHKMVVTNDIDNADLILTHDNIGKKYRNNSYVRSGEIAFQLWNYDSAIDTNQTTDLGRKMELYDRVVCCENLREALEHDFKYGENILESWALSGMALKAAYLIDTKAVETLSVDDLLNSSANKAVLDESLLETLTDLLNSYDSDNHEIAKKIIPTIKHNKNVHLLWKLMQEFYHKIDCFRDKDVQYWLHKEDMYSYYSNTAEEMILELTEKHGKMDKESFIYFENICREEIEISNRELYVFKVKLKKEFRHYYES